MLKLLRMFRKEELFNQIRTLEQSLTKRGTQHNSSTFPQSLRSQSINPHFPSLKPQPRSNSALGRSLSPMRHRSGSHVYHEDFTNTGRLDRRTPHLGLPSHRAAVSRAEKGRSLSPIRSASLSPSAMIGSMRHTQRSHGGPEDAETERITRVLVPVLSINNSGKRKLFNRRLETLKQVVPYRQALWPCDPAPHARSSMQWTGTRISRWTSRSLPRA